MRREHRVFNPDTSWDGAHHQQIHHSEPGPVTREVRSRIRVCASDGGMAGCSRCSKLSLAVTVLVCILVYTEGLSLNDLLDRASQLSDKLHSLSTSLTNDLDSHFPSVGGKLMKPSMCHTSSLQIPNDKDQALRVPENELLSLVRSLLMAWSDPLALLSSEATSLPHPERNSINSKTRELQDHTNSLGVGLERLVRKMGSFPESLSSLPFNSNDLAQDNISRLVNFHFLLSCFRRDSHKIDSFLKVLRCRAAKMLPEMC